MGGYAHLVDTPTGMEGFRVLYHIPQGVSLRYCPLGEWHTLRKEGEAVIPIIAFIKGGTRLPIGRMIRDCIIAYRICPHQCAPNLFRVFGSVDSLNEQMELRLTWHDIVWMYECYLLIDSGHYLKSRSSDVRLISCLPKSNKGMKDDFLIVSSEWHNVVLLFFSFSFFFFFWQIKDTWLSIPTLSTFHILTGC